MNDFQIKLNDRQISVADCNLYCCSKPDTVRNRKIAYKINIRPTDLIGLQSGEPACGRNKHWTIH